MKLFIQKHKVIIGIFLAINTVTLMLNYQSGSLNQLTASNVANILISTCGVTAILMALWGAASYLYTKIFTEKQKSSRGSYFWWGIGFFIFISFVGGIIEFVTYPDFVLPEPSKFEPERYNNQF